MLAVSYPAESADPQLPCWGVWEFLVCGEHELPLPSDYPDRWGVVRLLLEAGIAVNDQDSDGNTALHLFFSGHANGLRLYADPRASDHILRLLLARGADPYLRNQAGMSALQLAIRHGCVFGVWILAKQRRIELVDRFSLDEIVAMFADAARHNDGPRRDAPYGSPDSSSPKNTAKRLIELLLDMDYSYRLAWNLDFLHACLAKDPDPPYPIFEVLDQYCLHGLELPDPTSKVKLAKFRLAVQKELWEIAGQLLQELPNFEVDEAESDGKTLLFEAIPSALKSPACADFVLKLIDAGANIHRPVPSERVGDYVMTPLKLAIMELDESAEFPQPCKDLFESMLSRQPIRGNPQAASQLYLHFVTNL
ncbi:hypothetical protein VTK56DRAFT_2225 [Thermocarpiscus australiensis]